MQKSKLQNDVKVFGIQVKIFPEGIGEVFDSLIKMFPEDDKRSYYGISEFKNGSMHCYAAAEETFPGGGKIYDCDSLTIEKGEYATVAVHGWRSKTDTIKDIFREILQDKQVDHTKPAVEWYKNNDEMLCMIRTNRSKTI